MKKIIFTIIRSIFAILAVILAGFLVAPMGQGIINIGNITGTALCVWIFCVSVAPIHRAIRKFFCRHKFTKFLYRFVNVCFIIFAVYGTVVTSLMTWAALQTPTENATVVVLGAQVKPWGPSAVLNGRISGAQRYLEEHENANAVLSGGQGSDEPTSEAQCMYDTLTKRGIDKSRLYPEDKSTNTTENIKNSVQVIEENNLNSDLAIATDFYHQLRVRIIMNQLGIEENVGAVNSDTSILYLPVFTVREWFALPYQVLFR
ncbi:YdcF family protein [Ruminococcus sp.]|uniref:YdcF family protein n=1 Tax=Ruminococcus sp. TaxID=41978 RepID=UPI0025E3D4DD|nr:YdcF family protein [Ruminococcus sp.]MCI6617174.1 YdcF family protein [Ruminococcus sp.]